MGSAGDWCLIESDPGVFTLLIKSFGVSGVQVEELWSLDVINHMSPTHGLIFLFKWVQDDEPSGPIVQDNRLDKIFFAKQVINNACATQAVLSILMNCKHPDVQLGQELSTLKEFSMSFDPKMRGLTISNSETIRAAHNSMARQTLFEFDPKMSAKDDEVYHFVSYIPIEGRLYELDGLRDGPIDHGPIPNGTDWIDTVRPIIMKRINRYREGEISFNLMAVVSDQKQIYQKQLDEIRTEEALGLLQAADIKEEVNRIRSLIAYEDKKHIKYELEMARRKHNYLPFIIELLKILAEKKKIMPLYEKAKDRATERSAKKIKLK